MPFKKTGKNTYRSASGRKYSKSQVALYYATGGFKAKAKKSSHNSSHSY